MTSFSPATVSRADPATSALDGRRIVLDCRWLGRGGAGRVTELVLAGLASDPPPGRWILWGDANRVSRFCFTGAEIAEWRGDPHALLGQRDLLRVPPGDVVVWLHQMRPLRPGRSVTFILDTIPLRHGGGRPTRLAKRAFLSAVARLSTRILTISEFSRRSIASDLGMRPEELAIVPLPEDETRARSIARLRAELEQEDVLLYLGRFDRHKNLEQLCVAFGRTRFAAAGGRLLLAGGWPGEVESLRSRVEASGPGAIELREQCAETEVEHLLATSRALVQPSLEEGYGLPAFEAAASGLPVAASRTGGMVDLPEDAAVLFDPTDVEDMVRALDEAVARPARPPRAIVRGKPGRVVIAAAAAALAS